MLDLNKLKLENPPGRTIVGNMSLSIYQLTQLLSH